MGIHSHRRLGLRLTTLLVWALATGSVVCWGLRLMADGSTAAPPPAASPSSTVELPAVARALGASSTGIASQGGMAGRFVLQGVVAGPSNGSAALIVVDGQSARPFRVGSTVGDGLILQSVTARRATLAASPDGPAALTLEMAPLR